MKTPPIALGAIVGSIACAFLAVPAADAVRDLRTARRDRATLAELAAGPPPSRALVVEGAAIRAKAAGEAADRLAAQVRARAAAGGLLVQAATPVPSLGLARVRLSVSGSEDAVVAFTDAVERGTPLARFASWDMVAKDGAVTLSGEVVATWR